MTFTKTQVRQLKAKLDPKHVKSREANGVTLLHIEGWHAIAEANRIFGFDGWDRETVFSDCVWKGKNGADYTVAYTTRVRIRVRAGERIILREGSGTGCTKALSPGEAYELALKAAETDATKRALATFGNLFGLALYDREQSQVKRPASRKNSISVGAWLLHASNGEVLSAYASPKHFAEALRQAMKRAENIDELFGLWAQNVETVRAGHRLYCRHSQAGVDGMQLVEHLRACARALAAEAQSSESAPNSPNPGAAQTSVPAKIDKSLLTIGEPKRIRSKEHLHFVAQQPCLICGRTPSHAHHIRYGQTRGLALKVSDEFTVPLCAIHHSKTMPVGTRGGGGKSARSILSPLLLNCGATTCGLTEHQFGANEQRSSFRHS